MELFEGGTYRPIRVLFNTPIYRQIFQDCWHMASYKVDVAIVAELLRLQKNQLLSEVTPEDIVQHLQSLSKHTARVQLLDFQLQKYDDDDEVTLLLSMARQVNESMRMRDIQLDAQRLLSTSELIPPNFWLPKVVKDAKAIGEALTKRHQQTSCSERLQQPRDVVLDVVPKVLQGLWVPKQRVPLTMPSMKLDKMAVGVTKGVQDHVLAALGSTVREVNMSRSARDEMIASIIDKLHEAYPKDIRRKMLKLFSPTLLHHIAEVTAGQITALFQPRGNQEVTVSEEVNQSPSPSASVSSSNGAPVVEFNSIRVNLYGANYNKCHIKALVDVEEPEKVLSTSLPQSPTISHNSALLLNSTSPPEKPEAQVSCELEDISIPLFTRSRYTVGESAVMVKKSPEIKKSLIDRFKRCLKKRCFTRIHPQ